LGCIRFFAKNLFAIAAKDLVPTAQSIISKGPWNSALQVFEFAREKYRDAREHTELWIGRITRIP
jgi:hypothetical protein